MSNFNYAKSVANGETYKPIRTYITYDFETAICPKNEKFGEDSVLVATLHPITVAWTVKVEDKAPKTFSLYRNEMSVHDFIQTWLNQMLASAGNIDAKTTNGFTDQINVIGYNSARFDVHLILRDIVSDNWTIKNVLGDVKMMVVQHVETKKEFRSIDALGFRSGGTLDHNAQAFNPGAGREKGSFPYEFLTIYNYQTELQKSEPFTHESSYSSLKQG
jgi:hypothetical protein